MKTAKQLIEDELQKTIHQLKEVSLLQGEKQTLVSYKKELEQLLFLKKLSDTYHQDDRDFQFRFLIIRKEGAWKIDDCQRHDGGWIKYGL